METIHIKQQQKSLRPEKNLQKIPKAFFEALCILELRMLSRPERTCFFRLCTFISCGLVDKYLAESAGNKSADEYLLGYDVKDGINGLDFSESEFFKGTENTIKIVVEYDIRLYFWGLFLKDNTLHVIQRVDIPTWLDGDGKTYRKK